MEVESLILETIREKLETVKPLPQVNLISENWNDPHSNLEGYVIEARGRCIGHAILNFGAKHEDVYSFVDVRLERSRGERYGLATYAWAISEAHSAGTALISDERRLTDSSLAIWDRLVLAGVAEIRKPYEYLVTDSSGVNWYRDGLYVAAPLVT